MSDEQRWIRGPKLRKRWGDMPNSTFYDRLQKGRIPQPEYPFGPVTPYWRLSAIEEHERITAMNTLAVQHNRLGKLADEYAKAVINLAKVKT